MISLLNVDCRADGMCHGTERLPTGSGRTHSFHRSLIGQYKIETWSPNTAWRPTTQTQTNMTDISNTVVRPMPTLQAGVGSLEMPRIDIGQHYASRQTEINQQMTEAQKRINAETAAIFTNALNQQNAQNTSGLAGTFQNGLIDARAAQPQPANAGIPSWVYFAAGAVILLLILFFVMKK
ncbi:hypothetical protein [Rhodoflexus sp.]